MSALREALRCGTISPVLELTLALMCAAPDYGERVYFSDEAAMTAGAVAAGNRDGAGLWYNPAGLAAAEDTRLDVSGSTYGVRLRRVPHAVTVNDGTTSYGLGSSSVDVFSSPNVFSLVRRIDPRWVLGATVLITSQDPRNTSTDVTYGTGATPRQRLDLSQSITTYHAGLAVSWQPSAALSLGAALYGFLERQTRSLEYVIQLEDAFMVLHSANASWKAGLTLALGVDWRLDERWSLALVLRAPSIAVVSSTQAIEVTSDDSSGLRITGGEADEDGRIRTPARMVAGARFRASPRLQLTAEAEAFVPLGLAADAQTAIAGRAGMSWVLTARLSMGAGLFVQSAASSAPKELGNERLARAGATLGLRFKTVMPLTAQATPIELASTLALRYAADFGQASEISASPDGTRVDVPHPVAFHEVIPYVGTSVRF